MSPIPTNLITGFPGVGKTTALIDLLKRKHGSERWAVIANKAGAASIHEALRESSFAEGVIVREVTGECLCCSTAPLLQVALHLLLLEARPDRLILETTGHGHTEKLLDMLKSKYADRLDVRAVLCLVDPADFGKPEVRHKADFLDQIRLADVLVMNKLDTTTPKLVDAFQEWAGRLDPQKLLIAGTSHGRLDMTWLDLTTNEM